MSKRTLLADAEDEQKKAVAACNEIARKIVAHLHPFMGDNAEAVLSAEEDEVWSLATDLIEARSLLKKAHDDYEALKRRM